MSTTDPRVAELRRLFDGAFAEPPPVVGREGEALLALQVGGDPYALRMAEISGLARDRRVAVMPGSADGFCGLSGHRGLLMPVWDLHRLLGYAGEAGPCPWLCLAAGEAPWALCFGAFEGYRQVKTEDLRPFSGQGPAAHFSKQAAWSGEGLRPVLELAALKALIQSRIPSSPQRSA